MKTIIHAVSIEPGSMETVCGKPLGPGMASTGFGRAHQDVCPSVNCVWCEVAMGLRVITCDCESMGGRFGAHRPECPWQVAFEAQLADEQAQDDQAR